MRVLTTGTFALPHAGHFALFEAIKRRWPDCHLIVGINGDRRTKELKWYAVIPVEHRKRLIAACKWVDEVVIFEEDTPTQLIYRVRPDVFVKGTDWMGKELPEAEACRAVGAAIEFMTGDITASGGQIAEEIGKRWIRRISNMPGSDT